MKKFCLFLALCILLAELPATALAADRADSDRWTEELLTRSACTAESFDASGGISVATEHQVYGRDVGGIVFTVTNNTGAAVEFGSRYVLETERDGSWYAIGYKSSADVVTWTDVQYTLAPGQSRAQTISLGHYAARWNRGNYRIVKEVGGRLYAAPFALGASTVTADTPYGYKPLEQLSKGYTARAAADDGAVLLDGDGVLENGARLTAFVEKVGLGVPAMVRLARQNAAGEARLTDVIYENGCFLYRQDHTRDSSVPQGITESVYAYLIAHTGGEGEGVYLSNYASAAYLPGDGQPGVLLYRTAWGGGAGGLAAAVRAQQQARVESRRVRYTLFLDSAGRRAELPADSASGDGAAYFTYGGAGYGASVTVKGARALTGLTWLSRSRLAVWGETGDGRQHLALYHMNFDLAGPADMCSPAGAWTGDCFGLLAARGDIVYWADGALRTLEGNVLYTGGRAASGLTVSGDSVTVSYPDGSAVAGRLVYKGGEIDSFSVA